MKNILIVDDDPQIGDVLTTYFEREGFTPRVCTTVRSATDAIAERPPDFMILDVNLPDGSGLDILRGTKESRIPVIMLTARSEELDRILGLELGADDYVTKPFSPREVVARVRAVLRRSEGASDNEEDGKVLRVGALEIDPGAHEVRIRGQAVTVTRSEFRILTILAERPGQVFTRAQLLDLLHDDGSIYERTLDRHVNNLRRKIEEDVANPEYVQTVYGVGYKMRKL